MLKNKELVELLNQKNITLSSYESITGGLFASLITDISGAGDVFYGGIVTYTNEVKVKIGNVNPKIIDQYGVVSQETANEMAICCQDKFKTNISISLTGNAGPKNLDGLPTGTVYIGIKYFEKLHEIKLNLDSKLDRISIKKQTCEIAINKLLDIILKN